MTSLLVHFCSAPLACFVDALDNPGKYWVTADNRWEPDIHTTDPPTHRIDTRTQGGPRPTPPARNAERNSKAEAQHNSKLLDQSETQA